jgi:hypothetical protein
VINEFSVSIRESKTVEDEYCLLTAIPSYETEGINFESVIEKDFLGIDFSLGVEKFNELVRLIENKSIDSLEFSMSSVAGFYAEWTPTISTRSAKILTVDNPVEGVDVKSIKPEIITQLASNLTREMQSEVQNMYLASLQQRYKVDYNKDALKKLGLKAGQ